MSNIPSNLKYTTTHEWVKVEGKGQVTVGITEHAQSLLGDLVFVELPNPGEVKAGDEVAVVESVKAAADVYSPISGEVIAVNEALVNTPELVNSDPYGEGWLFRLTNVDDEDLNKLLDAAAYEKRVAAEGH